MQAKNQKRSHWRQLFIRELQLYFLYVAFLTLFFSMFTLYEQLLLKAFGQHSIIHYSYNLIEALVLAKVILIGESMKLGEKFSTRPLIIPVLHKTIVFCIFLLIFEIVEKLVLGVLLDKNITVIIHNIATKNTSVMLAKILIMFVVFLLLFSFTAIGQALGKGKLFLLFFRNGKLMQ